MCATKVLYPVHSSSVKIHTPINSVIKNSDKNRARTIANIHITDQASLTRASDILVRLRFVKLPITQLLVSTCVPTRPPSAILPLLIAFVMSSRTASCALLTLSGTFIPIRPLRMIAPTSASSMGVCLGCTLSVALDILVSLLYKYIRCRVSSMVHPHLW